MSKQARNLSAHSAYLLISTHKIIDECQGRKKEKKKPGTKSSITHSVLLGLLLLKFCGNFKLSHVKSKTKTCCRLDGYRKIISAF